MVENIVMMSDSYKYGHYKQYPKDMCYMYDYIEARKGPDTIIMSGLQYYLKRYLSQRITTEMVEEAAKFAKLHGIDFNYDGWMYIAKELDGRLPIKIKAIEEGVKVKPGVPLVIVESTDENVPWIVGWVETILMKIWYPTVITTKSKQVFEMLKKYGSEEWARFAYHNFGDRSMTSVESAAISGFAHNCVFYGTDNFNSLKFARDFYSSEISAFSVFASEHSSTTANAEGSTEKEIAFIERMVRENDKEGAILSFVADSYDIYNFTNEVTKPESNIRKSIIKNNQTFVIRPDSGNPIEVISKMFEIMEKNNVFDIEINGKKASSWTSVLWGDGVNPETIDNILKIFTERGYAAENFVFGSGTQLGQTGIDRDTFSFAMKCSYIERNIDSKKVGVEVFKNPITDSKKQSKKGKVITVKRNDKIICIKESEKQPNDIDMLKVVFENGEIKNEITLDKIRENIDK